MDDVSKRPTRQTFAEVVREVEATPVVPEPKTGGVTDPNGTYWTQDIGEISPSEALDLATSGAAVAWDPCGCGGYCGFTWFGPEDVQRLVRAGTPIVRHTKRRHSNISKWVSEAGRSLVIAEDAVRWGDLLS